MGEPLRRLSIRPAKASAPSAGTRSSPWASNPERGRPSRNPSSSSASSRGESLRPSSARAPLRNSSATVLGGVKSRARLLNLLRQFFGLVFLIQRTNQLIEVAVHDIVELVEREIDAMVGDSALRKIIGANTFGAIA